MNHSQWLEWRRNGLGASDAPVVMGVSPFKSRDALRKEKLFGITTQKETPAMRRGKELESEALRFFMGETGVFLEEQKCYEHPERPWMRCTVDGINEEEGILVEVKVPKGDLYDSIPRAYYPQCQHQIDVVKAVLGAHGRNLKKTYLVSYNETGGKTLEVSYDTDYIKTLVEKETEFWNEIQSGFKSMEKVNHWESIKKDLVEVREALQAAESLYKESVKELVDQEKFLLSDAILHADGIPSQGYGMYLYQKERMGAIDAEKIKEETGVDVDLFRKPSSFSWKLEVDTKIEKQL